MNGQISQSINQEVKNLLLLFENVFIKELLQLLIGKVDAELFKAVYLF